MHFAKFIKTELPRILGFSIIGGGGFFVHATMVLLQTSLLRINPVIAWFPAFLAAVIFTWLMNRFLTFRGLGNHSKAQEAGRYFVIQSIGASINFAIYASLVTKASGLFSNPLFALVCGAGTAFLFNYSALRALVFRQKKQADIVDDNKNIDDIYYEHVMSVPMAERIMNLARQKMYEHFIKTMQPHKNSKILDFGASETETEQSNILEKNWQWPENITCVGIGDGAQIMAANPKVKYKTIKPGQKLPFTDKSFDIAYSNAVLEHVGSKQAREEIIAELKRVAKKIYISVPNRWFPVEHHTAIPLLHYWPKMFRAFVRDSKYEHWSLPQNLQFLSEKDLQNIFIKNGLKPKTAKTGLWLGVFSSNITAWADCNE